MFVAYWRPWAALTRGWGHRNEIQVDKLVFLASLIALKSSDINIILGTDCMSAHHDKIDCFSRTVQVTHPSGEVVNVLTRLAKR